MLTSFAYPDNYELRQIEPDLIMAAATANPIMEHFPIVNSNNDALVWEVEDAIGGLQMVRGLGGQPSRVQSSGSKSYIAKPGYYGEFKPIDEEELTRRGRFASFQGAPAPDITDLVRKAQDLLVLRESQRIQKVAWDLAVYGKFQVIDNVGSILHSDSFKIRTVTPTTPWTTYATSTPIDDFKQVKLASAFTSCAFDSSAVAYMNMVTLAHMLKNTNAADLGGRKVLSAGGVLQPLRQGDLNTYMTEEGLPLIKEYNGFFVDADKDGTALAPQRFIPDGYVVIFGARPNGAKLGEYRMTINANNPGSAPGSYVYVNDSIKSEMNKIPRRIEVHRGHNGGPVIFYPNGVVVLKVF